MSRRPLIAGNWKMNGLLKDGLALAGAVADLRRSESSIPCDVLICPPFTLINVIADAVKGSGLVVGGQDCSAQTSGAHTGDTSPVMLKDAGCSFVILGHSERRTDHAETNEMVKVKAAAVHKEGLVAIVCVGETLLQRDAGQTFDVNRSQIRGSLPEGTTAENTVIAYEPVWAIGTGRVATPEQAQEVHAVIRAELVAVLGQATADKMRILYGGSMKPDNAKELLSLPDVDGGLIGGASLKADDFWSIARACA